MLARTCNSIGKDSLPSKAAHHSQQQQQQQAADKKENSTRLIKSTSPGKKSAVGVDGMTSRKDQSSTTSAQSRQSTAAAGRGRLSLSPTSSQLRPCRDGDAGTRHGDASRWAAVNDGGRAQSSGGGSPASTSRTADSDRDSVDDLRGSAAVGRHHDRQQTRQTLSPYNSSDTPPSLGLYESLRLQQKAAALQAAVYSPLHQLLAQRHFTDPLAMYSASLQAAAVVAAAATQASLRHTAAGRLPGKDYRLGDVLRPCGVDTSDLLSNGDVNGSMLGAAGMFPLRPPVAPVNHSHPYTCSWLVAAGEFCAQRFSTSEELFSHLRTHVDGAAAAEDPLRFALPPTASCSAFAPTVGGFQSGSLPVAGTFGVGGSASSLAAAHAAASFYRSKAHRSARSLRDVATSSPTSTVTAAAGGASLLLPAAAAAPRYHPYKWTPSPFVASQLASALGTAAGLPNSDLTPPMPPALSAFLQQPPYAALFSAQTLGTAVP